MTVCMLTVGACVCLSACTATRLTIEAVRLVVAIGKAGREASWSGPDASTGQQQFLTRTDVSVGMAGVRKEVGVCFDRHGVPGLVRLRVRVQGRTGRPGLVTVLAPMGSTPTGRCIADAVAAARFPVALRDTTFHYAYRLRPAAEK